MGSITLPLPVGSSLQDTQDVKYSEYKFGPGYGTFGNQVGPGIADSVKTGELKLPSLADAATGLARTAAGIGLAGVDQSSILGPVAKAAEAFAGLAVNQFYTILLDGPTYKRYSLTFNLAPHSEVESGLIRDIIRRLRLAAAPGLTAAGLMWSFPELVQCVFIPQGDPVDTYMYRFKPAVLDSVSAQYAPNGESAAFYKTGAPESVRLTLNFQEIEYWIRDNFIA